MILTIILPLIW
jgi:amino acid permease